MSVLTYLVARSHGLRTRLLPYSTLRSLAEARDMKALAEGLLKTDYGNYVREIPWGKISSSSLERVFTRKFIERCYFVAQIAPDNITDFLQTYFLRFEVMNLRRILRGKISKVPEKRVKNTLIPIERFSALNFDALLRSESVERAIELLKETMYMPSQRSLRLYRKHQSLLPIEAELEKAYVSRLNESMKYIPPVDRKYVKRLLGTQFDVWNCITIVGGRVHDFEPEILEDLIIPFVSRVPTSSLREVVHAKTPSQALDLIGSYDRLVEQVLAGNEPLALLEGVRYVYDEAKTVARQRSSGFSYVMVYLTLCEMELRDLVTIASGKQYNLPAKEIVEHCVILD